MSAYRQAATAGLHYAAHLVAMFGWEPASPEAGHLSIHAHLHTAASKTAVEAGIDIRDTAGLMGMLLETHLEQDYLGWECEDGRVPADVANALTAAAGGAR